VHVLINQLKVAGVVVALLAWACGSAVSAGARSQSPPVGDRVFNRLQPLKLPPLDHTRPLARRSGTALDLSGPCFTFHRLAAHRQIAEIIADKIASGQYLRGSRIPTESELVATYEIARSTARRAVAWLRDHNLIETVLTRGSYVL
jgi:GntR family transcriptional regulator